MAAPASDRAAERATGLAAARESARVARAQSWAQAEPTLAQVVLAQARDLGAPGKAPAAR
ncbi:MAG: hypothetical protein AB7P99_19270 [Vicinamibacterales bacterium]